MILCGQVLLFWGRRIQLIAHQCACNEIHQEASMPSAVREAPHVGGCHEGPSRGASNLPSTTTPGPPCEYHFNAGANAYLLVPFAWAFLAPIFQVVALVEIIGCLDLLLPTRKNKSIFKIKTNDMEIRIWCNSPKCTFLLMSKANL